MRIEELILDGFKSYPVRTSISGWDQSFNAITGLNGSGKSNILDAICFVLGITNLQAVRAQNLQDLIYKRGQAGITKASVTIVFDNADKSNAPPGFEQHKQITITRQVAMGGISKYLLCGHRSTQQMVQNLFQSVQLNINNPNFLIMQGKITKVLNMKPAEILGMIEEAAGTSMFEDKKDKAAKTMAKKDKKMDEIRSLLQEEIQPKLDRLREEKRVFQEWQKAQSQVEKLNRLVIAHDWVLLRNKSEHSSDQCNAKQDAVKAGKDAMKRIKSEMQSIEEAITQLTMKRDKEAKGGNIQTLETQLKEFAKDVAKKRTQIDLQRQTIIEDEAALNALIKASREVHTQHADKKVACSKADERLSEVKNACDASSTTLKQAEGLLQSLITGLSSSSSEADAMNSGYMGQIAQAKAKASRHATEAEQTKTRIDHVMREVKEKEPKAKQAARNDSGLGDDLNAAKAAVICLEKELAKLDWNNDKDEDLRDKCEMAGQAVRSLLDKRDALKSKLSGLDFQYASPFREFDRTKVKGLVVTLIELDKANEISSMALEVCAGGRLYNVVVENEKVGSQLLENGKLTKRVTMIPLNQIQAFVASADKIAKARTVSKGTAKLALSLIGYPADVAKAMQYVFGGTLVCPTAEAAQAVTFHKDIRLKSVTLEGDVYDPSGTLSGGSKPNTSGILVKAQELAVVEKDLRECQDSLKAAEAEWEKARPRADRFAAVQRDLDLKRHEVVLLEQRFKESNASIIVAEVDALRCQVEDLKSFLSAAQGARKESETEAKRLEKEMNEFKNNRESKLEELKKDIAKKKTAFAKQSNDMKAAQKEAQTVVLELDQLVQDIAKADQDADQAKKGIEKGKVDLTKLEQSAATSQAQLEASETKLQDEMKVLSTYTAELNELDQARKHKEADAGNLEAEEKKLIHEAERLAGDTKKLQQGLIQLQNTYAWILEEQKLFGKEAPYDFSNHDMNAARATRAELEQKQQGRAKKVNPKVMVMIDQVERQEKELLKNHAQVLKDKAKIEDTIAKLDAYKREALTKTHKKVSVDFGSIFGELLPGNFAKLVPPEGQDIMQGLEVKVQLGSVWKQSLTELSGGQRSLIALSLIMSLLQFKPAPMYILDEVDAALDLSHTQHIGQLFRTRFHGSQFIVVSLKEGLFTNANVLFRTRFRDGTSICERTAQRSTNPATVELYTAARPQTVSRARVAAH